jgi:hypothetical protein
MSILMEAAQQRAHSVRPFDATSGRADAPGQLQQQKTCPFSKRQYHSQNPAAETNKIMIECACVRTYLCRCAHKGYSKQSRCTCAQNTHKRTHTTNIVHFLHMFTGVCVRLMDWLAARVSLRLARMPRLRLRQPIFLARMCLLPYAENIRGWRHKHREIHTSGTEAIRDSEARSAIPTPEGFPAGTEACQRCTTPSPEPDATKSVLANTAIDETHKSVHQTQSIMRACTTH